MDHAVLNILEPRTFWLNMGLWPASNFPAACEALASALADHISLNQKDVLLDVGFGCGDSLLLYSQKYNLQTVYGITSLKSHYEFASRRIDQSRCKVYHGDACLLDEIPFVTKITALDCAYHFHTRRVFLDAAFQKLESGGMIGLADVTLKKPLAACDWVSYAILYMICKMTHSPLENYKSVQEYHTELVGIGYTNVDIVDVTERVFDGLGAYIRAPSRYINNRLWMQFVPVSLAMSWASNNLRFVLARGQKP